MTTNKNCTNRTNLYCSRIWARMMCVCVCVPYVLQTCARTTFTSMKHLNSESIVHLFFFHALQSQSEHKNAHLSNDCVLSMRLSIILKVWIVDIMLQHCTHTEIGGTLDLVDGIFRFVRKCFSTLPFHVVWLGYVHVLNFLTHISYLCFYSCVINFFSFCFPTEMLDTLALLFPTHWMDSFPLGYYKIFESWEILFVPKLCMSVWKYSTIFGMLSYFYFCWRPLHPAGYPPTPQIFFLLPNFNLIYSALGRNVSVSQNLIGKPNTPLSPFEIKFM